VGVSRSASPESAGCRRGARAGDPVRGQVYLPSSDDHPAGPAEHGALVAAQRRAKPGQQLTHPERLGHVVVGAGVERGATVENW
jgi:hypothetical protein